MSEIKVNEENDMVFVKRTEYIHTHSYNAHKIMNSRVHRQHQFLFAKNEFAG